MAEGEKKFYLCGDRRARKSRNILRTAGLLCDHYIALWVREVSSWDQKDKWEKRKDLYTKLWIQNLLFPGDYA